MFCLASSSSSLSGLVDWFNHPRIIFTIEKCVLFAQFAFYDNNTRYPHLFIIFTLFFFFLVGFSIAYQSHSFHSRCFPFLKIPIVLFNSDYKNCLVDFFFVGFKKCFFFPCSNLPFASDAAKKIQTHFLLPVCPLCLCYSWYRIQSLCVSLEHGRLVPEWRFWKISHLLSSWILCQRSHLHAFFILPLLLLFCRMEEPLMEMGYFIRYCESCTEWNGASNTFLTSLPKKSPHTICRSFKW